VEGADRHHLEDFRSTKDLEKKNKKIKKNNKNKNNLLFLMSECLSSCGWNVVVLL